MIDKNLEGPTHSSSRTRAHLHPTNDPEAVFILCGSIGVNSAQSSPAHSTSVSLGVSDRRKLTLSRSEMDLSIYTEDRLVSF